jgi:hypothetical protein
MGPDDDKIWSSYSSSRSVDVESLMFCVFFYDDKIWSSYSSSRSVDVESLMFCVFFYVWVLFVYFQGSVFDGCV